MSKAVISQREARRLRKRVERLERERASERAVWGRDYPGGWHIGNVALTQESRFYGKLEAAQILGRVLVAKATGGTLEIHAAAP